MEEKDIPKESSLGRLELLPEADAGVPLSLFTKTLPKAKAKKIYSVINRPLEAIYEQCRTRFAKSGAFIELYVFHGTSTQSSGSIIKNGFDASFSGKAHGQAHGPGVYVATTAAFSHGYSKKDVVGGRRMFICTALDTSAGGRATCKKTDDIYVFQRESQLLPRWVIDYEV